YFSEELKFAKENGYSVRVIKGYRLDAQHNVFDSYIKDVYEKKYYPPPRKLAGGGGRGYKNVIIVKFLLNL
ncbi:hypothetical protein K504DRAFT_394556, partial [Pleomassaria siparia CBS 279.74]